MLTIDGSFGEGGGQILRTSLSLSLVTGTPLRITNIRAKRRKPGLLAQHLTAVHAAARIAEAQVMGAAIGSTEITFAPKEVRPGEYAFQVGTAGSATLVLQTVLPALLTAPGPAVLTLEGGTHNPFAPPFDFLDRAFLPLVNLMGPKVSTHLERPGFYPAGGGRFTVSVEPATRLRPLQLLERGAIRRRRARAIVSRLPLHIAERELKVIQAKMRDRELETGIEEVPDPRGPGNVVLVEIESEHVTEVFTAFGQRGVRAEEVGRTAARETCRYLDAEVAVGEHLADQLLVPLALAGGGAFTTLPPTDHTRTNGEVIQRFLDIRISSEQVAGEKWRVDVK